MFFFKITFLKISVSKSEEFLKKSWVKVGVEGCFQKLIDPQKI